MNEERMNVDVHPVVLPLDRDGGDDDAPEGYPATNEDGTIPVIEGDTIWIKQYHCSCGQGCGGCQLSSFSYPIDGKRFHWANVSVHQIRPTQRTFTTSITLKLPVNELPTRSVGFGWHDLFCIFSD